MSSVRPRPVNKACNFHVVDNTCTDGVSVRELPLYSERIHEMLLIRLNTFFFQIHDMIFKDISKKNFNYNIN